MFVIIGWSCVSYTNFGGGHLRNDHISYGVIQTPIVWWRKYLKASVHFVRGKVFVIFGTSGSSPYFVSSRDFQCLEKLFVTVVNWSFPMVVLNPTILKYLISLDAITILFCEYAPKIKDGVEIIVPCAALRFVLSILPAVQRRIPAIC